MRSTRELILAAFVIVAAVVGLHHWRTSLPSRINGMVIDISTGRPVAGVRVYPKFLNGHGDGVLTDSRGRFSIPVPSPGGIWGVYVDDAHYAGLFGAVAGRVSHVFRKGDQDDDVVVPAIPAGELSGKVLDDGGHPIAGCAVELFRPKSVRGPLQLVAADLDARTGISGEYRFAHVDAGIYYLLAKCNSSSGTSHLSPGQESAAPRVQTVWSNLLYPQARTLGEAQEVVAMPGQRINGLDFRLTRTRGYLLKGRFIWADGEGPQLWDLYSNDFSLTPLDLGLAENQTASSCRWNAYPGKFECVRVTPGRYRLVMRVSPIWIEADRGHSLRRNDQAGETEVVFTDEAPGPVALEMHKIDRDAPDTTPKTPTGTGWLDAQLTGCGSYEFRLRIWDENGINARDLSSSRKGSHAGQIELAPGRYRIFATCGAYWPRHGYSYLDEVLAENAQLADVHAGRTTKLRIHALCTEEIYRMAVAHLDGRKALRN